MFRKNLIVAWRSLLKHKLQTGINIAGLSIGIAGCLIVYLLTHYELSFNKTIVDRDRIYRVYTQFNGQFNGVNSGVPTGAATLAGTALQGTDLQCMVQVMQSQVIIPSEQTGGGPKKMETQDDIVLISPGYFDLIQNYEWLEGAPRQALSEPFKVVLTESKAKQYFGLKDAREAIGRQLIYKDSLNVTVSGILKDPGFISDFHFTDFISSQSIASSFLKEEFPQDEWDGVRSADQLFVKATKGIPEEKLAANLKPLIDRFNKDQMLGGTKNTFKLQPLSELHYNQDLGIFDTSRAPAHKGTLYGLMLVASLLLLIAAINFVNLATVQATRRSKETGIRKAIGASRGQIARQFLVETFVIALLALPIAAALTEVAMRYFSEFLPEGLHFSVWSPTVLSFMAGAVLVVTFLAGVYPAFVMSAFHPAFAIKNQTGVAAGKGAVNLRKSLIVFQFVLAQAFIIGSMAVGQQLRFVLHKDLGFNKDAVVYFWASRAQKMVFKDRLEKLPEVRGTTLQNKPPMDSGSQTSIVKYDQGDQKVESEVHFRMVDTNYIHLYEIQLLAGRNLLPSDTMKEALVNETLAKAMGYTDPATAIGQTIYMHQSNLPIVGVVKDFHVQSLHNKIPKLAISAANASAYSVAAKIGAGQSLSGTIDKLKAVWEEVYPGKEFTPFFLDETVSKLYERETNLTKLINTATGLAIFISCLGLFGLAFFTVTQRSKEISVRKILGAGVAGIVALLSRDFVKLVVIALLIAAPLAYLLINRWLQDFAYRITVQWWVYLLAGAGAIVIAFLTVGYQSLKAALANPVESLKTE